jgi:tRNA(Arg) A34 adenosine deaminase TadA
MDDKKHMLKAVELSEQSPEPVGCGVVLVSDGKVIATEFNSQHADNSAIHHAEIKAIMTANKALNSRKLPCTTAYCSCESCAMCLTALSYAKVERIVFAKRMIDIFPDDPQSQLDPVTFVARLNFVPKVEQLIV